MCLEKLINSLIFYFMQIIWHGQCCFKITDKIDRDEVTIITDPYDPEVGFRLPKLTPDICTVSHDHPDHNNTAGLKNKPFIIDKPGEYEISGVMINGISSYHDKQQGKEKGPNIIFKFEVNNMTIAHLGALGHILKPNQLEKLGIIDILLIPVGGYTTINFKQAVEVINQIEPRIVIPMHYKVPSLTMELDSLDKFTKIMGIDKPEEMDKLKIDKKSMPSDETKIVVLNKI